VTNKLLVIRTITKPHPRMILIIIQQNSSSFSRTHSHIYYYYLLAHLFVKILRPGESKGTLIFKSDATSYYHSNHSKAEAIPLSALPKDTTSELAYLFSHFPFNAERQAGKL